MQQSQLEQLCRIQSPSQFSNILQQILKSPIDTYSPETLLIMQNHLIGSACYHKNFHRELNEINIKCLRLISQILSRIMKISKQSKSNIIHEIIRHLMMHSSCYTTSSILIIILDTNHHLLDQISIEKFKNLNQKIISQFHQQTLGLNWLYNINKNNRKPTFQVCQQQLENYLKMKYKPIIKTHNQQSQNTLAMNKIPPLILPTSKSINSSRYSIKSKDERRRGVADFRKLAANLGETFIAIQLGSLLAHKRTLQVQQFSHNEDFRSKCLDKIQTQRLNSSRLGAINENNEQDIDNQEQSKKYLKRTLLMNFNLIYKKIKKMSNPSLTAVEQQLIHQICSLVITNVIKISQITTFKSSKNAHQLSISDNFYTFIEHQLVPFDQILSFFFTMSSQACQLTHLALLLNRNKQNSPTHYQINSQLIAMNDQLLGQTQLIRNNQLSIQKGGCRINPQKRYYADITINYLQKIFRELFSNSSNNVVHNQPILSMDYWNPYSKFYKYQNNLLILIGFYLSKSDCKSTPYQVIDNLMPIMLLIKRQILQLSLPYLNHDSDKQTNSTVFTKSPFKHKKQKHNNIEIPLIYAQESLLSNYLNVISNLMTNNKHVQKLISNIFIKNIHFMQLVQNYTEYLFRKEIQPSIISVMRFYKKTLEIYHQRKLRNQDSKTLKSVFQHLGVLFCPKNGCIAKILLESEQIISPWNLQNEQSNESTKLHLLHQILKFISDVYSYCQDEISSSLLEEEVASFYIKYSIMSFIKLYSFLTVNQLVYIQDITSKSQDPINYKMNSSQIFMLDFLKILTNISIHRTPQISKKFRQYRVLEFFIREFQLQFTVAHNIDKYLNQNNKVKPKVNNIPNNIKNQSKNNKKPIVPGLNLTGQLFKGNSKEKSSKNSNEQSDEFKLNLTMKDSTPNSKKLPTNFHLKLPIKDKTKNDNGFKIKTQQSKVNPLQLMLQLNKVHKIEKPTPTHSSQRNLVYFSQRRIRKIYSNKFLHCQSLLLVLSLLLYKGLLDSNYCQRFPIAQGKINVLYILHYHLNHQSNKQILPLLGSSVELIKPYLSGQRLLKLLSNSFTDLSHYQNWEKISKGAYGTVYSCSTNLNEPKQVAIKQMNFPRTIYQRCVLHDIFTQITCLENFRLDPRITTMYNYGVVDNTYVIVMKKYQCSLRDWSLQRIANKNLWNLSQILTLYLEVLKITQLLHDYNVTHYDIKGDNIMLQTLENGDLRVVFGDFGQCKIFENEKQQLDMKSRGTQCIQSPQMLTLTLNNKKESDNYDRRKRIGTTKASDIWSLGCLLYQMLTGQYLYHRADWFKFYGQVTSPNSELLTKEDYERLNNNVYIIDFLKYILIRDPQHRPSISNIITRFQNIYALLVTNPQPYQNILPKSPLVFQQNLQDMLNTYLKDIQHTSNCDLSHRTDKRQGICSKLLKIMEDIYFCDVEYLQSNTHKLYEEGITHIITTLVNPPTFFVSLVIVSDHKLQPSRLCPKISDLLREVLLMKGKLLFINDSSNYATNLLIFTLSYWFRCSVYQTWCLINTQILLFPTFSSDLQQLSQTLNFLNKIQNHVEMLPKLQCICGSVTIILKRKIPDKKGQHRVCKCKKKNINSMNQEIDCPSLSCLAYIQFLRKRYNIGWDHIKWTYISSSLFLTDPFSKLCLILDQNTQNKIRTQIILNSSVPSQNMAECGSIGRGWKMYKCKACQMWIMAVNSKGEYWMIMNNQIKSIRQGIMIPNAQQNFKMTTPALNYYTLSKLHMIQQ